MNFVIAKIAGKDSGYEKIYSGESIYCIPNNLDDAIDYSPSTILEEGEWFKICDFSKTDYAIGIITRPFRSTDYPEANKVRTQRMDYIISYQEEMFCFQRILKHSLFMNKRIVLGETVEFDKGEKSIVINDYPDAIYDKKTDLLYFRKLTLVAPIFDGIGNLYREATEDEVKEFLENDFIELSNDYSMDKIKKNNRKRIAMALETLKGFGVKERKAILKYTHDYYPALQYDDKKNRYTIKSEEELKFLLWGIEQRYYTTPVTKEKRVANSIVEL